MTVSHFLEDFGGISQGSLVEITDVILEEQKLEAFEKGYQAGWDDSTKAREDDSTAISTDFAQTLRDLSFTYHEAYSGLLNDLRPLLQEIVETVLPRLANETLGPQIADILHEMLRNHGNQPVQLIACPEQVQLLTDIAGQQNTLTVSVLPDPAVMNGQVQIKFGSAEECDLNLGAMVNSVSKAVDSFFQSQNETILEQRRETA